MNLALLNCTMEFELRLCTELPLEIWHQIATCSGPLYRRLVLVATKFMTADAKNALVIRTVKKRKKRPVDLWGDDCQCRYVPTISVKLPNGKFHNVFGPAFKRGGHEEWYFDGVLHRIGGPAVTRAASVEYWQHGVRVGETE